MKYCLHTSIILLALSLPLSIDVIAQEVDSVSKQAVSENIKDTTKTYSLSQSKADVKLEYIYDFGKVLKTSDFFGTNLITMKNILEQIERDYNVKCIIVSVDHNSNVSQETISQLFKQWNVGEAQKENILMLLFKEVYDSDNDKYYPSFIYVGKNIDKIFTPRICRIIKSKMNLSNNDGALFIVNQIVEYTFLPLLKGDITPEQYIEESNQNIKDALIFGVPSIIIILWLFFYMRLWSYGNNPAVQSYRENKK